MSSLEKAVEYYGMLPEEYEEKVEFFEQPIEETEDE